MGEFVSVVLGIAAFSGCVWLTIIPVLIYNELKRQGIDRERESMKIISVLVGIHQRLSDPAGSCRSDVPKSSEATDPLQATIDARSQI